MEISSAKDRKTGQEFEAHIHSMDEEIDRQVYILYGLMEEEIKNIGGK